MLASMGKVGAKEASQVSKKLLGFDFIPLITSLVIFYVLAFLIAKFMEASILAKGGLMAFVNLLGYTVPTKEQLPNAWSKLFTDEGINGIKFWDLVNVSVLLIVIATALMHKKNVEAMGGQVEPTTWAIFITLGAFVSIAGLTKLVMNFSQNKFQREMK